MGRIVQWAKDHPKLAIALGVGVLLLIYLYYRRSATAAAQSTDTSGTGLSSQDYLALNQSELSAATALQGQQVAAGVATAQYTDQLQAEQTNAATQLAIAKLQADVTNGQTYAQTAVSEQTITAQENVSLATIQANQQTAADQLALETALINVIAGKNNVLNPSPTTPINPVVVSSNPNASIFGQTNIGPTPATAANASEAPGSVTQSPIPYAPVVSLPGVSPSGTAQIQGVNYFAPGPEPLASAYAFPNEEAAIAAGAGSINPTTGRFVPIPGLDVTY